VFNWLMPSNRKHQKGLLPSCYITSYKIRLKKGTYRGADKSLARPTSRRILFDSESISFDASLVIYINNTNIPPIMIINKIYENQNFLSL
jgi:hypothetical protein